ncbi:MAG: IS1634 family transposase [Candidatus Latescibacterota bacterium]
MNPETLTLESLEVGAHPLVRPFLERLDLRAHLQAALGPPDRRWRLSPVDSALLLLRNFTLSRYPLYGVPEWARRQDPQAVELEPQQLALVNDDRLGRTLDRLYQADPRSLTTRLMVHMVRAFDVGLERCHQDSTTVTFSGLYAASPPRADRRRRLRVLHGHNKDHRPDLKQLVWSLTVSADGAVPVHYNVYDGNVTDDQLHVETWDTLRALVGRPDFIYVADSKLCTREDMAHVHQAGGHFLTVLPRTRQEDPRFRAYLLTHEVGWQTIWERPARRRRSDRPERFEAVAAPEPTVEGYRLVWYRSSNKWQRDQRAREQLEGLRPRLGRHSLKMRAQVQAAVDGILASAGAGRWVQVELVERPQHTHRQAHPGRPGRNTRYVRHTATVWELRVDLDAEAIRASAAADGIFPLVTDFAEEEADALQLLQIYKYQAFVEKRYEQLKTAAQAVPLHYKSPERIEAFLFLYFVALTLQALLERQVRTVMKQRRLSSIPLYPEERDCAAPTADKILELFAPLRRHRLRDGGTEVKTFWHPLSRLQRQVLDFLGVPPMAYGEMPTPPSRTNPRKRAPAKCGK